MGRLTICRCGYVKFWEGEVMSEGNSQHLLDWYSFTHLIHGFGFYFLLWLVGRRWPIGLRFALAVLIEGAWEVIENTDFIIDRYRAETISLNYYGDSIINSVSDTLTAALGFGLAYVLPRSGTIALALAIEIFLAAAIRDNLTLNLVMLVHPIAAVKAWQAGVGQK